MQVYKFLKQYMSTHILFVRITIDIVELHAACLWNATTGTIFVEAFCTQQRRSCISAIKCS